jgi:hypothetical protein
VQIRRSGTHVHASVSVFYSHLPFTHIQRQVQAKRTDPVFRLEEIVAYMRVFITERKQDLARKRLGNEHVGSEVAPGQLYLTQDEAGDCLEY